MARTTQPFAALALGPIQADPWVAGSARRALGLPPEIFLAILDFVPQPSVLAMAAVSRACRMTALAHHNYYLYIPLFRSAHYAQCRPLKPAPSSARALDALERATRNGTRVALELHLLWSRSTTRYCSLVAGRWENINDRLVLHRILRAVRAALKRSIVRLHVAWDTVNPQDIKRILALPAPRLESLTCMTDPLFPYTRQNVLSDDLFAGDAPNLREVVLRGVYLPHSVLSAFRSVVTVRIAGAHLMTRPVALHFPKAVEVDITFVPFAPYGSDTVVSVDYLAGARFQTLRLSFDQSRHCTGFLVPPIPSAKVLEISGFHSADLDQNLKSLVYPCSMTIDHASKRTSIFESILRDVHTVAFSCLDRTLKFPLGCTTRTTWQQSLPLIVSLRLNQRAATGFLQVVAAPVFLPVLASLVVEVTEPKLPIWPDSSVARSGMFSCPVLLELIVVWNGPTDTSPDVSPADLDIIARCFSLKRRLITLRLQNVICTHPKFPFGWSAERLCR